MDLKTQKIIKQEKTLTPQEYLNIERKREERHEFLNYKQILMAGASYTHNRICNNLSFFLTQFAEDLAYAVSQSDLRVAIPIKDIFVYPDIVVNYTNPLFLDSKPDTLLNPILLIEVLSPSTEGIDRGIKSRNYRLIDSLKEYIIVSQDFYAVESYFRNKNGVWELTEANTIEEKIKFRSLDIEVPLKQIYKNTKQ